MVQWQTSTLAIVVEVETVTAYVKMWGSDIAGLLVDGGLRFAACPQVDAMVFCMI